MADIRWDIPHTNRIKFVMVSPTNLSLELGEICGVLKDSASLTWGYYTDTRVSGSIKLLDSSNYTKGSFIRIYHEIPEWNYRQPLATLVPTDDPQTINKNSHTTSLTLHSLLYTMDKDIWPWDFVAQRGHDALSWLHMTIGFNRYRQYIDYYPSNSTYNDTYTFDGSMLARAFAFAKDSGNRLDVDGLGRITIMPYEAPSSRSSEYFLDLSQSNSMVQSDISVKSDFYSRPNRVVVKNSYNDSNSSKNVNRVAYEDVDYNNPTGLHIRGYTIAKEYNLNNDSRHDQKYVEDMAKYYLNKEQRPLTTWDLNIVGYLPLTGGSRVSFTSPTPEYPGIRECLVKDVSLDLSKITMKLGLKEIAADDKGDEK